MTYYLMLVAGFALLLIGGETLVRGAVATAERLGLSTLLIGVVVVGFGTSMPELVTSVEASLAGSPGIALGNIVGSNISNLLLVLGLSSLAAPILINPKATSRDGLFVLASTLLFVAIGFTMPLDRLAGLGLLIALTVYLYLAYRQEARSKSTESTMDLTHKADVAHQAASFDTINPPLPSVGSQAVVLKPSMALPIFLMVIGLGTLIVGGKLLVDGARGIALEVGISETIVGLTIVAIGTSAPEMVTCIIAALRRQGDVALGNILGSSVYNLLAIGGVTAMISPTSIPAEIATFDNLAMLAATLMMLIILNSGTKVSRLQGLLLVSGYVVYISMIWPQ